MLLRLILLPLPEPWKVKFGAVAALCPTALASGYALPVLAHMAANIRRYVGELTRWQSICGVRNVG